MELFWKETVSILEESAPFLLAGFFLAGLLNVVMGRYPILRRSPLSPAA